MSVWAKRAILTISYPVQGGHVTNWDDWEKLMHTLFYNELRRAPEEHPISLVVPPQLAAASRAKAVQILFETFNVPCLRLVKSDVASAYPEKDAIVVSSGYNSTIISVVRSGLSESFLQLPNVGGKHITELFETLNGGKEHDPIVEEIKAKLCFVSPKSIATMRAMWRAEEPARRQITESISVGDELFEFPEAVFFGPDSGLIDGLIQTILESGLNNVVLAGKNTLFPGLVDRLKLECLMRGTPITIRADADRGISAWKTASILAADEEFFASGISNERYDEFGPDVGEQEQSMLMI